MDTISTGTRLQQRSSWRISVQDDNVILAWLPVVPVVFWGFTLILLFLWMKRKGIAARHKKAKQTFTEALATKDIKIDLSDVATEQGAGGTILCKVVYRQGLFASGKYQPSRRMVFVQFYPVPENDPQRSFWHPATP